MRDNRKPFVFAGVQFGQLRIFILQFFVRGEQFRLRLLLLRDVFADDDFPQRPPVPVGNRIGNQQRRKCRAVFAGIAPFALPIAEILVPLMDGQAAFFDGRRENFSGLPDQFRDGIAVHGGVRRIRINNAPVVIRNRDADLRGFDGLFQVPQQDFRMFQRGQHVVDAVGEMRQFIFAVGRDAHRNVIVGANRLHILVEPG